jgi:carbon monoxide dehydrogenase subunit G
MPGVQSFAIHDERNWTATVKVPLGLGALAMTVDFEQTELRPPEYSCLQARGNGAGAVLNMQTSFTLEPAEDGARMHWAADVKILGPVGAMGQRVLQPIVRQQIDQVLTALERRVIETAEPAGGASEEPAPPA